MKRVYFIFLLLTIIITAKLQIHAEVRFVSKTGSSTPPYTSWATAADSIQKCINISQSGDTIYVANGSYKEYIRMIPNIALIGSGIDSCIIDTRGLIIPQFRAVIIKDSCLIEGFQITVHYNTENFAGIYGNGVGKETVIRNNLIKDCTIGISFIQTSALVQDNIIKNTRDGIQIFPVFSNEYPIVERNYISDCQSGISVEWPLKPKITNNIIYFEDGFYGITVFAPDSSICANNLVICRNCLTGIGYSDTNGPFHNNVIIGNYSSRAIRLWKPNEAVNNIVMNGDKGIEVHENLGVILQYNNVWNVNTPYINYTPDSTNISVDPMFVNADSLDFHLQMFSPLIDAGDPSILDKDGSRSDIGLYGGPYGESYTYQDLAPKPPRNLTLSLIDTNNVSLNWLPNTEADLYQYRVYRDSIPDFIYDTTKIIGTTSDTTFNGLLLPGNSTYFKITAIDNQNNQSPASEEVGIIITTAEEPKLIANNYQFYPNYPNPFNPSTTLSYRLKENGAVRLVIYDMKGEKITELVNKFQQAGYYEVDWDAKAFGLSSGVYLFRIEIKNENNIPVFSDMRKSILLK